VWKQGFEENIWMSMKTGCRKLYSGEVHSFYSSQNIIRLMKLKRVEWAQHITRMGKKSVKIFEPENLKGETT
jgi:hypothetical protein